MNRTWFTHISIFCCALLALTALDAFAQTFEHRVREEIRRKIERQRYNESPESLGDNLLSWDLVRTFYENRGHLPVWLNTAGSRQNSLDLLQAIESAADEGLRPRAYHVEKISSLIESYTLPSREDSSAAAVAAALDMVLTDAFFLLADHYIGGRIDPEQLEPDWSATRREADFISLLDKALSEAAVERTLKELLPPQPGYSRLRSALKQYRTLSGDGGWQLVEDGPTLKPGHSGPRVLQLFKRLAITDTLLAGTAETDSFTTELASAVWRFQRRHGLVADSLAGRTTLNELNVPCDVRVRQIEANMERWRWLPQDLGDRHIYVNIANFELDLIENRRQVWTTRVIVGKHYRKTPVFSATMTYMVLNPTWTIPPGILRNDVIPEIRKDPEYLTKKKMNLYRSTPKGPEQVDPATVDWSSTKSAMAYTYVQVPGPHNALGEIKFMFPNNYNVYLHDTPSRELFDKPVRTFSSGCIRTENPLQLAALLLDSDSTWSLGRLKEEVKKQREQTVRLTNKIPVHLLYLTAWVNPDGTVHFRPDIYDRDKRLLAALDERAPL